MGVALWSIVWRARKRTSKCASAESCSLLIRIIVNVVGSQWLHPASCRSNITSFAKSLIWSRCTDVPVPIWCCCAWFSSPDANQKKNNFMTFQKLAIYIKLMLVSSRANPIFCALSCASCAAGVFWTFGRFRSSPLSVRQRLLFFVVTFLPMFLLETHPFAHPSARNTLSLQHLHLAHACFPNI